MLQRDQYIYAMKLKLDQVYASMSNLEKLAINEGKHAQFYIKKEMIRLRSQSQFALDKLCVLKTSSDYAWEQTVLEMEKIHSAFTSSIRQFNSSM